MLWEQLVTDGHVRAARLRAIVPESAIIGLLLTTIGIFVLVYYVWTIPLSQVFSFSSDPASALNQKAMTFGGPTAQVFAQSAPNIPYNDQPSLPLQSQLAPVYKVIEASLQATNNPPHNLEIQTAKESDDFWSWNWPEKKIFYLNKGDLRAFGVIVMSTPPTARSGNDIISQFNSGSQPVRWLAIFRKTQAGWDDVAIKGNGFVAPPGEKTASASDIPVSLRTLMSIPETNP